MRWSQAASADGERRETDSQTVLFMGDWDALPAAPSSLSVGSIRIEHCLPRLRAVSDLTAHLYPSWLMIGDGLEESAVETLVRGCQAMTAGALLAMLGPHSDWKRCERWLRRGCVVYLPSSVGLEACLVALTLSRLHGLVVAGETFQRQAMVEARRVEPLVELTSRERQVLTLLCLGLRNSDIAATLNVGQPTVEFHVHNILDKLGARTRVEAVNRAVALGLESQAADAIDRAKAHSLGRPE